jgi:cytidine deaminase
MIDDRHLLELARQARDGAYAPYSGFAVGAALLGRSDRVYTGCNVENAAYPLTTCAERTAGVKAVSEGEVAFQAIAVVTATGAMPCGACRQVLSEFNPGGQMRVIVGDVRDNVRVYALADMLPYAFDPEQLAATATPQE